MSREEEEAALRCGTVLAQGQGGKWGGRGLVVSSDDQSRYVGMCMYIHIGMYIAMYA